VQPGARGGPGRAGPGRWYGAPVESATTTPLPVDGVHGEVTGAGPPVVLTHDGLLHAESWDAQVGALAAAGYRVAHWDRRGYGRSPRPTAPFSSVDDLAAVVRAVSGGPATLVGCSYGGYLSAQCALDHPDLVAALVLVGPVISGLPLSEHFQNRGGRDMPPFDAPVAEQIAYWSGSDPWFVAPANTAARQRLHELLTANPHNLRLAVELERRPEAPALPRLAEISVPTLIVAGEQDIPDVHAHCGAIQAGIPGARRVVLAGSGHVPQLEVPEAFNRLVLDFLAGVHGGQPAT
jgi:3-oxoadipate enol-lactonase